MPSQAPQSPSSSSPTTDTLLDSAAPGSRILQVQPEDFLPPPRPLMLAGGWAGLLTLGGALMGCWFLPYATKVQAPAIIRPQPNSPARAFVIQAWIPNASINQVQQGQPVQMRLNSCPYPDYGVLGGEVVAIASDTVQHSPIPAAPIPTAPIPAAPIPAAPIPAAPIPAATVQASPAPTMDSARASAMALPLAGRYEIAIQPSAHQLVAQAKSCELRAGMEGRADILVGEERLASFLLRRLRLAARP